MIPAETSQKTHNDTQRNTVKFIAQRRRFIQHRTFAQRISIKISRCKRKLIELTRKQKTTARTIGHAATADVFFGNFINYRAAAHMNIGEIG